MGTSRIGRTITLVGAAVSLTLAATAGVAVAGGSGAPVAKDGGSAVVTERGTTTISDVTKPTPGTVTPRAVTTKQAGGGTWTYGRRAAAFPNDICFSNYVHNSVYHSATTIFGDGNSKKFADPSLYANSSLTKNGFFTGGCQTYWNTY